jgi:O-acetyl-ADP-ribose deacetylase (regulator of RNase III)
MIQYKKGNLLDTPDNFIVHGCNAQGVMGSGVAKAIREKYPAAYEDYKVFCDHWLHGKYPVLPSEILGKVCVSLQDDNKTILNAITQEYYGKSGKKYVSYDAVDLAMQRISDFTKSPISMPKIGAGLGGGHWDIIEAIVNVRLVNHEVTVWTLE